MNVKNVLIAFIILVVIITGVLVFHNKTKINKPSVTSATPSIQQKIESKFKGLTIPEGVDRVELRDVSGGVGMGLATRSEILADLPELAKGQFYQGWLEKDGKTVLLGNLKMAKGGWMLDYDSSKYPGYNKVIVTQGLKHILEGSF